MFHDPLLTDPNSSTSQESAIIRVTAHLFLRALLSDVVQRRIIFSCSIQNDTIGISHLQDQFVLLVSDVYDAFGDLLGKVSAQMEYFPHGNRPVSIPALVNDVVALVCTQEHFNELRADVMALLMGVGPRGSLSNALTGIFQAFAALVREATIASVTANRNAVVRTQDENFVWNQRWLLKPGSVQIVDITSNNPRDVLPEMGLANVAQLVYEFGCIDIAVGDNGSSLLLQSALSLTGDTAPMTFVLDGKLRVFRVLPTGVPTIIQTAGGWSVGDYKAVLSEGGRLLTLDIFNFAEGVHAGMVPLHWVKLFIQVVKETVGSDAMNTHESKDQVAFVHGTVYGSTYSLSSSEIASEFNPLKLSECRVLDRAATWSGSTWTPLREVQVGYIVIPRMGGV